MSLLTISSSAGAARPLHALTEGVATLHREWAFWRARRALGQLDEAMLHDIGLGRGEIDRAVRYGRRALCSRR